MIKATFGDRLDDWIRSLFPFLFHRPLDPEALTWTGVGISTAAAAAFAWGALPLGGVLLLAGGFFDLVDGVVARHQGTASPYGAFLDSTLDRFVDMVVWLGILLHYAGEAERLWVFATGVAWTMSVLTSYAKARAEQLGAALEGGLLERGERVGLVAAGAILGLLEPALVLLALGTTATAIQRLLLARRALTVGKPLRPRGEGPVPVTTPDREATHAE